MSRPYSSDRRYTLRGETHLLVYLSYISLLRGDKFNFVQTCLLETYPRETRFLVPMTLKLKDERESRETITRAPNEMDILC